MGLSSEASQRTRRTVDETRDHPDERWARDVVAAELGVAAELYVQNGLNGILKLVMSEVG